MMLKMIELQIRNIEKLGHLKKKKVKVILIENIFLYIGNYIKKTYSNFIFLFKKIKNINNKNKEQ